MKLLDAIQLRPLDAGDCERVREWRNSDHVRRGMYTDHVIQVDEHDAWIARALASQNARFLIAELDGIPVGFVSFTSITPQPPLAGATSDWAFYIGEPWTPRGVGSCMEVRALDHAFEVLHVRKLSCEVLESNIAVVRMHEKFGFSEEGLFRKHVLKNGQPEDVHRLALFADEWRRNRTAILSTRIEKMEWDGSACR
jgi:UDP-4-amino-4,6-dideoxy-N-acetyl-beta-L-altrosamine N-acetyltransferase